MGFKGHGIQRSRDLKVTGFKGHGIQRSRDSKATGHLAVWARSHVFLFHLHHGMSLIPFSDNLFSFFSQKKFKMPPHPIHRWTPQSNADFHHCRQAYHILSNHILSYLILSYHAVSIHSKSVCPWCPDSSNNFDFSAKRLAENAETIKFSLFAEIKLQYASNYAQLLLKC